MIFSGDVVRGAQLATKLFGLPTANLELDEELDLSYGVYTCLISRGNQEYQGMLYIGPANLELGTPVKVEVHLFDYSGSPFYGETLSVKPLDMIREYYPFETMEEAKKQVVLDSQNCKDAFTL